MICAFQQAASGTIVARPGIALLVVACLWISEGEFDSTVASNQRVVRGLRCGTLPIVQTRGLLSVTTWVAALCVRVARRVMVLACMSGWGELGDVCLDVCFGRPHRMRVCSAMKLQRADV